MTKQDKQKEIRGWIMVAALGATLYLAAPFTWRKGKATRTMEIPESNPVEFDGNYPDGYEAYPPYEPDPNAEMQPEGMVRVPTAEAGSNIVGDIREAVRRISGAQQQANQWKTESGDLNVFRIVICETKRREAMGHPGRELERYKDGDTWAIGYGNHIKYLSPAWKKIVKKQGYKVSEVQAREMMYETFHNLGEQIKKDLPGLNHRQQWAIKSLAFNWGYGNVKRSKLWKHLKARNEGLAVTAAWMRTQVATENHKQSRRLELALWHGEDATALTIGKAAYKQLQNRGDFEHYED
jgi:GH24 family phage-related lysozyme (muramidase)